MDPSSLELLAPAKDLACGLAAINHGADAVYIGGPLFGARAAAGNSLADIERLAAYAHRFHARVYVALNTLLEDREFDQAVALCHRLHALGADGLIIQDVGLLEADLPPIPLHASTQMNNRTVEKVRFLEQAGFAQVVLARELSLARIREIRAATTVPLEFFVHGALCVCYSGQCYFSEIVAGRSANRGQCAQFCRHRFDLFDREGRVVAANSYVLSLQDLDLSAHLAALSDAGIRSFKIEGRLKDANYVKNVTAAYRLALDALLHARPDLARSSSGQCAFAFVPDPERSFHRGATDYFLTRTRNRVANLRTPKSTGKRMGRVLALDAASFTVSGKEAVHNDDGLCFFDPQGVLVGIKVNRAEGNVVFPRDGIGRLRLSVGTEIYRNRDSEFDKALARSTLCRTIAVRMRVEETIEGLALTLVDEDGIVSSAALAMPKQQARAAGAIEAVARRQLSKSGETLFSVIEVAVELRPDLFVPAASFNELRRQGFAAHLRARLQAYTPPVRHLLPNEVFWPTAEVDYRDNITNRHAAAFYRRHGVRQVEHQTLRAADAPDCALMTTKYCLRFQLGICPRSGGQEEAAAEPLILADKTGRYTVTFDCAACEMIVRRQTGRQ
ncbi:U32 family peptidase [Desulfobulbus sp.]|uniref:peptidase U32 family protein n=1 Tax=Desulfobulbus sp. TaxID=895 RepID=UPI00286F022F|nr:U32 family peptidase [Desulfobulbus sp.]